VCDPHHHAEMTPDSSPFSQHLSFPRSWQTRYRCWRVHPPSIPSAPVAARSAPASPRTVAGSDRRTIRCAGACPELLSSYQLGLLEQRVGTMRASGSGPTGNRCGGQVPPRSPFRAAMANGILQSRRVGLDFPESFAPSRATEPVEGANRCRRSVILRICSLSRSMVRPWGW
jgi:hypothetical protein